MQRIRVTRSGRKHRIGNKHILTALDNAGEPIRNGDQLIYIGMDDRGIELMIIVVPDDKNVNGLAVIHAHPTGWRQK